MERDLFFGKWCLPQLILIIHKLTGISWRADLEAAMTSWTTAIVVMVSSYTVE